VSGRCRVEELENDLVDVASVLVNGADDFGDVAACVVGEEVHQVEVFFLVALQPHNPG